MLELLSFLITAILILYIVRAVARIFLPMLFQNVINKAQQNQQGGGRPQNNYSQSRPDAKVKVDYIPKDKKGSIPDSEGDFVDYEEIK